MKITQPAKNGDTVGQHACLIGLALLLLWPALARAVPSAITYQGRLTDNGAPATGSYDLTFSIFSAATGGSQAGPTLTNAAVPVANGLFTVTLDFGPNVFSGSALFMEIAGRTNGLGAFGALTPRQPITSAPYAVFSGQASTAATATTAGTATSFGGSLGGDVSGTQAATVVGNVGGQSAANVASGASAANAATAANTANTIVKRDVTGNFAATAITATAFSGNGGNLTSLNGANISSGTVGFNQLANNSVTTSQIVDGTIVDSDISGSAAISDSKLATIVTAGKVANSATTAASANTASAIVARDAAGTINATSFSGGGASLTSLNANNISSGTLADPRLSANIAKLDAFEIFTGLNTITNLGNNLAGANVGVGTHNPLVKLTVAGSGVFNTANAAALLLTNTTVNGRGWELHSLDSGSVQLADFNAGATRVLVDASGNVGIGPNTSPGAKLDVQGDTIVRGLFSLASSSVTVASGGTLAPTTSYLKVNSFTSVALSGTTAIADGTAIGNVLVLQGPASATSVTIPNAANTKLGAASRVLGTGDTLTLIWDGSDWVETAFSNN